MSVQQSVFQISQRSRPARLFLCPIIALVASIALLSGCSITEKAQVQDLQWATDESGSGYYRGRSTAVEYACLDNVTAKAVQETIEPRSLARRTEDEVHNITLNEAVRIALSHNEIIESSALGGVGSKAVLTNPANVASVYDPAIQESGVLFGRRGMEAALSEFDASFRTSMSWTRDDSIGTRTFTGDAAVSDIAAFRSSIGKQFANGSSLSVSHNWDYLSSGTAFNNTAYAGTLGLDYRMPLLQGSGVEYTRIAGPATPGLGAITGVSQGVSIARINQDITIADFEIAVRNAIRDIENAYWDLYLAYRTYDTATVAHESAFRTWKKANDGKEIGVSIQGGNVLLDEAQGRDRLYETRAQVETSLNQLYKSESELRRLIGLPMNDGSVLCPIDEPVIAEFVPDWNSSLADALTQRVELRRQKWQIKSLQLQLTAARSLVRPRLDIVGGYDVNAYGDRLLGNTGTISAAGRQIPSAYESLTSEGLGTWSMGFEFEVPLGFRFARSQVRSYELQVAKATAVLASQEKNVAHDVTTALQDITSSYKAAVSNRKRLDAAAEFVRITQERYNGGLETLDLVVRAQSSLSTAENAYYQQVIAYNKAINNLNVATGRILENNGITLAEGRWEPEAYCDAMMRYTERSHACENPYLQTEPCEFVSPGPTGTLELRTEPAPPVPEVPVDETPAEEAEGTVEPADDPSSV